MRVDLSWADSCHRAPFLGEIFALAFVRGVAPLDALRRIGGHPDTLAERTPDEIRALHEYEHGYPEVASVLAFGEWTVLFQPTGAALGRLVDALSRGTEAVAVVRHDYASPSFSHAVDGELVTHFDPSYAYRPHVTDPGRVLPLLRRAGFDPDDEEGQCDHPIGSALRLAFLTTGVLPAFEQLTAPLPSVHFDEWFSRTRPSSQETDPLGQAEEIVAELHLGGTPGLAEAVAAARRGERVVVTPDSDLGRHVREWSRISRVGLWSLNDHRANSRMTEADDHLGTRLGRLLQALRGAFRPDLA